MKRLFAIFILFLGINCHAQELTKKWFPGHYLKTAERDPSNPGLDSGRDLVKDNPYFVGYMTMYYWKSFEPVKDQYDFSAILGDLAICQAEGKKLMFQISNVGPKAYLPDYMLSAEYEGGFWTTSDGISRMKIWLPQVRERWNKMIRALAEAVDEHPCLAAIKFIETAGYNQLDASVKVQAFLDFHKEQNAAAAAAFKNTIVIQHVNAGPPPTRDPLMKYIVEDLSNGFGGPDILNYKPEHLNTDGTPARCDVDLQFSPYYAKYKGLVPLSVESQRSGYWGGTAQEKFDYSIHIGNNMMAWASITEKPTPEGYTIHDVIDVVTKEKGRINTTPPPSIIKTSADRR
jgi:hypothetical protein